MRLNSLLTSAAIVLMGTSQVLAADAVVAEPEPMDYVKVCDMYGAGFFYIPGTETCLKISGELRVQYNYNDISAFAVEKDAQGNVIARADADVSTGEGTWYGRVNFDAREETDYGTLRSYIRTESTGGSNSSEGDVHVRDAYIELGGLSTGYRTSRVELGGLPGQMFDGAYFGGGRTMYADYTFAANGLSAMVGASLDQADAESVDGYARLDYSADMFSLAAVVGMDNSTSETAYGVWASVTPTDGLVVQGYYNAQTGATQFGTLVDEEAYVYGIGASYQVTDNVNIALGYYAAEFVDLTVDGIDYGDVEATGYSANLAWTIVPNLVLQLGYNHEELDDVSVGLITAGAEEDNYRIRLQRNF
ncbi:MAG: porin [Rhizobiaceae bacterium]